MTGLHKSEGFMSGGSGKYAVGNVTFAQIIKRARNHDDEALTALYQHALPTVYRYVNIRLRRPDLVEDVVSEVFLDMVEAIGNLRSDQEAGFFAWLYQIAQGKISRALKGVTANERKFVRLPTHLTGEDRPIAEPKATDLTSDPAALQEWQETLEEVELALQALNDEQKMVITGRFFAGQKFEELALALGKQPGAIRVMQFRALAAMAAHLGAARESRHKVEWCNWKAKNTWRS